MANTTQNPLGAFNQAGKGGGSSLSGFRPSIFSAQNLGGPVSGPAGPGKGGGPDLSGFRAALLGAEMGGPMEPGKGGGGSLGGLPEGVSMVAEPNRRQMRRRRRRRRAQEQERGQLLADLFAGRTQTMGQRATRGDLSGGGR